MLPYNQIVCRYAPYYCVVNIMDGQMGPLPQDGANPQTAAGNSDPADHKKSFQQTEEKISEDRCQKTQKSEPQQALEEVGEKICLDAAKTQLLASGKSTKSKAKEPIKPKRPQNYLTQRAFYMKQKLKSKERSDKRILRRRPKEKSKPALKVTLRSVEQKKKTQSSKPLQKHKPIKKESQEPKEKKNLLKLKEKVVKDYLGAVANIPPRIHGIYQINEFCRVKRESLLKRRVPRSS